MKKNIKFVLLAMVAIVAAIAMLYFFKNRAQYPGSQAQNSLGGHDCLIKFRVEKNAPAAAGTEILTMDIFQPFASGAFFGRIKDYCPESNQKFSGWVNQMMQEQKVKIYAHLRADVCLYREDLFNPENGATLYYYIEHYYCTNRCQTGRYDLRVDLDAAGNFAGYRQGDIY